MPVDIIEMLWQCPACRSTVLGRYKACCHCGQFRTPDVKEWMPDDVSHRAAVRDAELLNKFGGGEDRHCEYCGSSQWKVDDSCSRCGSPAHPEEVLKKIEAASEVPEEEIPPPMPKAKPQTYRDPAPIPKNRPAPRKRASQLMYEEDMGFDPVPKVPWTLVAGIGGGAAFVGLILYLVFHTVTHVATVTRTQWTHTTEVQRHQVMHHDGWHPPGDAFNVTMEGSRIHHYDHVVDHYDTVTYTYQEACGQNCTTVPPTCRTTSRTCVSNKNGSATCSGGDTVCSGGGQSCSTKYCSRTGTRQEARYRDDPVYRNYYAWDVWEWVHNRNVYTSALDTSPYPPTPDQVNLGARERAIDSETYEVIFTDVDDHVSHKYMPASLSEFKSLPVGTKKTIEVGTLGGVTIIKERK